MDFAIDTTTGDIAFDDGIMRSVTGADAIRQHILVRLRWFYKEWFLDTRKGVPYVQRILGKTGNLDLTAAILRRVIETTPGVLAVTDLTVVNDENVVRGAKATFRAQTTEGPIDFSEVQIQWPNTA